MVWLLPTRPFPPIAGSFPPMIADGSAPPSMHTWVIIAVVVVLPCVPETAMEFLYRQVTIPSITERSTTGMPRSSAATSSGLSCLTAAVYTKSCASPMFSALCPIETGIP